MGEARLSRWRVGGDVGEHGSLAHDITSGALVRLRRPRFHCGADSGSTLSLSLFFNQFLKCLHRSSSLNDGDTVRCTEGHVSQVTLVDSLPSFHSFPVAASCHFSCKKKERERARERRLSRPQKPEEFFTLLSWRGSRARRHQGPGGLVSRNGTPGFFQPPSSNPVAFSLIVNYLAESLIMQ